MKTSQPKSETTLSSTLKRFSSFSAIFGGTVLVALVVMICASITMRAIGMMPIQGDFELLQVGLAVVIGSFLPWCHLQGGNMFVDFVTTRLPHRSQFKLDAIAGMFIAIIMALIAWRSGAGALSAKSSGEVTMIREFPIWISYALMVPGLALTSAVAFDTAMRRWKDAKNV